MGFALGNLNECRSLCDNTAPPPAVYVLLLHPLFLWRVCSMIRLMAITSTARGLIFPRRPRIPGTHSNHVLPHVSTHKSCRSQRIPQGRCALNVRAEVQWGFDLVFSRRRMMAAAAVPINTVPCIVARTCFIMSDLVALALCMSLCSFDVVPVLPTLPALSLDG